MLRNPRIDELEAELRRVRERHFLARTPTSKAKCREQDQKLRLEIAGLLKKDGWGDKTARQLAGWDPYDQNASSGFFDSEWMFGVQGGFDVVVANPPYIDSETMTRSQPEFRDLYATLFDSARGNWDLFIVFIEQGIRLLSRHGMQSYIVPNKFIGAPYSEALRNIFLHHAVLEIRDYSSVRVFKDSDVYPVVFVLEKNGKRRDVLMTVMSDLSKTLRTNRIPPEVFYASICWDCYFEDSRILGMLVRFALFSKLGVCLRDIYGAATVSEAYEIKKLIKNHTGKETKPFRKLINTGTIDRYCSLWSRYPTQYIKDRYAAPIVYDVQLRQLSETRLHQARAEKIIIGGMTKVLECFYDKGEYLAGKSTTIILGDGKLNLKYLMGILNSALVSFWYRTYYKSLTLAGGYLRISNNEIKTVPIPQSNPSTQKAIISFVDRIEAAKKKDPAADTTALEREIDQIVYKLYGLTKDEIKIVEGGR